MAGPVIHEIRLGALEDVGLHGTSFLICVRHQIIAAGTGPRTYTLGVVEVEARRALDVVVPPVA